MTGDFLRAAIGCELRRCYWRRSSSIQLIGWSRPSTLSSLPPEVGVGAICLRTKERVKERTNERINERTRELMN